MEDHVEAQADDRALFAQRGAGVDQRAGRAQVQHGALARLAAGRRAQSHRELGAHPRRFADHAALDDGRKAQVHIVEGQLARAQHRGAKGEGALAREHPHDHRVVLDQLHPPSARHRRGHQQADAVHVADHAHEGPPHARARGAFDLQAVADGQTHVLEGEAALRLYLVLSVRMLVVAQFCVARVFAHRSARPLRVASMTDFSCCGRAGQGRIARPHAGIFVASDVVPPQIRLLISPRPC